MWFNDSLVRNLRFAFKTDSISNLLFNLTISGRDFVDFLLKTVACKIKIF